MSDTNNYYPKIDWNDEATLEQKVRAIYNILNNLSREMSIGKVPNNKKELQESIKSAEQKINVPLSIAFVKMAEKGDIDEVTASEHAEMFLGWNTNTSYVAGDLRTYPIETKVQNEEGEKITITGKMLYKCLQAHTSQDDWTPDVSNSLWKCINVTESGIAEWSQPISFADAYMIGDEVMYNGVHYRSIIDSNVWSPTDYPQGWEVVE